MRNAVHERTVGRTLLLILVFAWGTLAAAQQASLTAFFETVDGASWDRDGFASGDVLNLRVVVENTGATALRPGEFWVAFPPVVRATLFGNESSGFSFPDRMLDADGKDVMVDYGAGDGLTQLHAFREAIVPGASGALHLRVTVLSSTTDLADLPANIYLVDSDGNAFGRNTLSDGAD